jgi:glycosyltransferase involved in cell wall biosynthesis
MRILFAMADPHLPQYAGGAQSSSHELALELVAQGHQVAIHCELVPTDFRGLQNRLRRRLSGRLVVEERGLGYSVYRQWRVCETVPDVVKAFKPDVAVMQIGQQVRLAAAFRACGVPTLIYLRNVEVDELQGDPRTLPGVQFIANSQFTARSFQAIFGIDPKVIPPLFKAENYRVATNGKYVTFINPHPLKGFDIAVAIARQCPDIKFLFIESWTMGKEHRSDVLARLKPLPNVKFRSRTSNMKKIYGQSRMMLMPSRWEEAWGRIASEAHFSGIPVVASNRGGLPESVGPGGVLLDPDGPIEAWVGAVRRLWDDKAYYGEKSVAALTYAKRPELDRSRQIAKFVNLMQAAIGAGDSK